MRAFAVFALALACGCSAETFACAQDPDCTGADGGVCESSGWCSFPDDGCPSGRRYGEFAGDRLAHECVPVDDATTSSTDTVADATTLATFTSDDTTETTSTSATASISIDGSDTTAPIDADTSSASDTTSVTDPTSPTDDSGTTGEPLDPDLVAWYRFDEPDIDGELLDTVGNHHGVCLAAQCPSVIAGVVGTAGEFDGLDDIVRVPTDADLQVGDAISIALWVRVDVDDGSYNTFIGKAYLEEIADTFELALDSDGRLEFAVTALDLVVELEADAVGLGVWMHVAGAWDGATLRMYLNGALVAEAPAGALDQDDHDVTLGAGVDFGIESNFFDGAIDDLRIYRRALVDDEVAAIVAIR